MGLQSVRWVQWDVDLSRNTTPGPHSGMFATLLPTSLQATRPACNCSRTWRVQRSPILIVFVLLLHRSLEFAHCARCDQLMHVGHPWMLGWQASSPKRHPPSPSTTSSSFLFVIVPTTLSLSCIQKQTLEVLRCRRQLKPPLANSHTLPSLPPIPRFPNCPAFQAGTRFVLKSESSVTSQISLSDRASSSPMQLSTSGGTSIPMVSPLSR